MVSSFDLSVVSVLSGEQMLEDRLKDVMLGSLELVQLYVTEYDVELCTEAAVAGRIDVLVWLRLQSHDPPCPRDAFVCRYATLNGHLDVLKWARANGCPE
jgi:hypothetical protein